MTDTSLCLRTGEGGFVWREKKLNMCIMIKRKEKRTTNQTKKEANVYLFKHLLNLKERCMNINLRCCELRKSAATLIETTFKRSSQFCCKSKRKIHEMEKVVMCGSGEQKIT